jgi:methionyl-tRNA formyltransferase
MILEIISNTPVPIPQSGQPVLFKRRTPDMSCIPQEIASLLNIFDHIRMLDADTYPHAFIPYGKMKIEFSRPALRTNAIIADAFFTLE